MKKILIGITGGIAAYKAIDVISKLQSIGHQIHVIMTDAAKDYCPSAVVDVLTHGNLKTETPNQTIHIDESKWCDVMIILPATANTIAKIANGIADNFLTTTFLALPSDKTRIICPAMNTNMWNNPVTQKNLSELNKLGCKIISPVEGLLACGDYGLGKLPSVESLVDSILDIVDPLPTWEFPMDLRYRGQTIDSYSFLDYDWKKETEINMFPHVGAFGTRRRHDIHKGIDIYAEIGTPVYPVEDGEVVDICPFTGPAAGFPFWEDTIGVYVAGKSGIVVYGELGSTELKIGDKVFAGDPFHQRTKIGEVARVLKTDKGRPVSMLHIELHKHNHIHTSQWKIGEKAPDGVLDPTPYLIKSIKYLERYV